MRWENIQSEFAICYIWSGLSILIVFLKSCIFVYILDFFSLHLFQRNFTTSHKHNFVSIKDGLDLYCFINFIRLNESCITSKMERLFFEGCVLFYERKMHFSVTAYVEWREPFVKMKTNSYSNTHSYTLIWIHKKLLARICKNKISFLIFFIIIRKGE